MVSVFVPISAFCLQAHFYQISYTPNLFEVSFRRDSGSTPVHKNKIVLLKVYLLVLSVRDLNNNNNVIFQRVVSRRMQLLNYFSQFSSQSVPFITRLADRLRDEDALEEK